MTNFLDKIETFLDNNPAVYLVTVISIGTVGAFILKAVFG